jgi:hypothetical protein
MKIIVAIPFKGTPDSSRLEAIMSLVGSVHLVISTTSEHVTPVIPGVLVAHLNHLNAPAELSPAERIRWLANQIIAPMAESAGDIFVGGDVVLQLDDSVAAQPAISQIITTLRTTPKIAFAGAKPRLMSPHDWPLEPIYDYATRCVAWRGGYFTKFCSMLIPDETVVNSTSIGMVMKQLDARGQSYLWTDIPVEES